MSDFLSRVAAEAQAQQAFMRSGTSEQKARALGDFTTDARGAWEDFNHNIAADNNYNIAGYGVAYAGLGSTRGGSFNAYFGGGSTPTLMRPGMKYRGKFSSMRLERRSDSVVGGNARFVVLTQPDADYYEDSTGSLQNATAFARTVNVQVYSAAALGANAPTLPTQGLDIGNAQGTRVLCSSPFLIAGGFARLWYFNGAVWFPSNVIVPIVSAAGSALNFVSGDYEIAVGFGRLYWELYQNTNSGGSGSFDVEVQVF